MGECSLGSLKCILGVLHECVAYMGNDGKVHTRWKSTGKFCGPNWNRDHNVDTSGGSGTSGNSGRGSKKKKGSKILKEIWK